MKEFNCLESCPDLGSCCREFALMYKGIVLGTNQKKVDAQKMNELMVVHGWPFVAKRYDYMTDRWYFSCPELGVDGKCSIYEERPSVCRNFKPKTDKYLCCVRMTFMENITCLLDFFRKILTFTR